jgi:hypothetical protein
MRLAARRTRRRWGGETQHAPSLLGSERSPRGERNGRHKLTEEEACVILVSTDPQKVAASRYGVSVATVRLIRLRRIWTHLKGDQ